MCRQLPEVVRCFWSGKRDSNPRLQPWQGCTLPLSYSRAVSFVIYQTSAPLSTVFYSAPHLLPPWPACVSSRTVSCVTIDDPAGDTARWRQRRQLVDRKPSRVFQFL